MKRRQAIFWIGFMVSAVSVVSQVHAKKPRSKKSKPSAVKVISESEFKKAVLELASDERIPQASSTLIEKGRGEGYYAARKIIDGDPESFWAEGTKGFGYNQWVAFHLPDESTHVEITPGAGKEQFKNFNRPKELYLDIYSIRLERLGDGYRPHIKWLGRNVMKIKDKPKTIRQKLAVKLPELVSADRTMYVGVIIIRRVFKGQFDDTAMSELKISKVWGE